MDESWYRLRGEAESRGEGAVARIAYGVMGDARGHVNRALAVAQELRQHDFLFVGGGRVQALRSLGYPLEPVPMLATHYSDNRVDLIRTIVCGVQNLRRSHGTIDRLARVVADFNPDLVMVDYEFHLQVVARKLQLPCLSLDNQHFLTKCRVALPPGRLMSRLLYLLPLCGLYSMADRYWITSFFQLPPKDPTTTEVFPALLRRDLMRLTPVEGDHVLVYHTSPAFRRWLPVLEKTGRRCVVYGMGTRGSTSRVLFRGESQQEFWRDLAGCRYVICNGSQNVIAEALHLRKPVLAIPIENAYEQFFNAHMLTVLGCGDYWPAAGPTPDVVSRFENRLGQYRASVAQGVSSGNDRLAERLNELIEQLRTRTPSC
jgi:uncharacterized protein (TIGR00661 family)